MRSVTLKHLIVAPRVIADIDIDVTRGDAFKITGEYGQERYKIKENGHMVYAFDSTTSLLFRWYAESAFTKEHENFEFRIWIDSGFPLLYLKGAKLVDAYGFCINEYSTHNHLLYFLEDRTEYKKEVRSVLPTYCNGEQHL